MDLNGPFRPEAPLNTSKNPSWGNKVKVCLSLHQNGSSWLDLSPFFAWSPSSTSCRHFVVRLSSLLNALLVPKPLQSVARYIGPYFPRVFFFWVSCPFNQIFPLVVLIASSFDDTFHFVDVVTGFPQCVLTWHVWVRNGAFRFVRLQKGRMKYWMDIFQPWYINSKG